MLGADTHELRALQLAGRVGRIDADDRLDVRVLLELAREPRSPVRRQAGDEDALRGRLRHQPNQTDFRVLSMSSTLSWIRARISCATVWTSALSSHMRSSLKYMGSRNRSLNLAGRKPSMPSGPSHGNVGVSGK